MVPDNQMIAIYDGIDLLIAVQSSITNFCDKFHVKLKILRLT